MKAESHRLIANNVYETLKYQLGIELNLEILEKASILPDYHYFWRMFSHRKKHLFDDVCLQINYVHRLIQNKGNKDIISYRLGIISHFICDFFTAPHNFYKKTELIDHIKYEHELNKYIVRNITKKPTIINLSEESVNIKEYIQKRHDEYLTKSYNFENDLQFSLEVLNACVIILFQKDIEVKCPHKPSIMLLKEYKDTSILISGCEYLEKTFFGRKVVRMQHKYWSKIPKGKMRKSFINKKIDKFVIKKGIKKIV